MSRRVRWILDTGGFPGDLVKAGVDVGIFAPGYRATSGDFTGMGPPAMPCGFDPVQ